MIDINTVPADVWLCIFEHLSPASLASLAQTCGAFHRLTHRCLLRDIRWTTIKAALQNVDDWQGKLVEWSGIPRTLTLKLPFEDKTPKAGSTWVINPSRPLINTTLYNQIHHQLLSFTRLQTLIFINTIVTPVVYPLLAALPSLRKVTISQCTFIPGGVWHDGLPILPGETEPPVYDFIDEFDFTSLPLTSLTLGTFRDTTAPSSSLHPFNLITASSLTTLTMTCGMSFLLSLRDLTLSSVGSFPSIRDVHLAIIKFTHDGELAIANFISLCTHPDLRVTLRVHDTEIRDRPADAITDAEHHGLKYVWKYEGPVAVIRLLCPTSHSRGGEVHVNPLEEVIITDALSTKSLIAGLERLRAPRLISVKMHMWDVEVLYAIRGLFKESIEEVRVQYGTGVIEEKFAITLGANILPDLKNIRLIKINQESSCVALTRGGGGNAFVVHPTHGPVDYDSDDLSSDGEDLVTSALGLGLNVTWNHTHWNHGTWTHAHPPTVDTASSPPKMNVVVPFDDSDFESYLLGWNRYCPKLRYVQFKRGSEWRRRFVGDVWKERMVLDEGEGEF